MRRPSHGQAMARLHVVMWDPQSYPEQIRREIEFYDELQTRVAEASGDNARTILELGVGSGETTELLLQRHDRASLVGIDSSPEMLRAAHGRLPHDRVRLLKQSLQVPLPEGPFDLVVSALTVHHLTGREKAELSPSVAGVMGRWSRFVVGDVVVPEDPEDARIELEVGYDFPSTIAEQREWLQEANLWCRVSWKKCDLAILVAHLGTQA
jgi:tRNA (cmo5U34)-methyltransferase